MDIHLKFATDESAENNGTWFDLGGDARLLVARSGNEKYAKLLTKSVERNRKVLDGEDKAAEAKSQEIMVNVMSQTILLGWENVSFKGKPLEYSELNARLLLNIKDFRRQVQTFSENMQSFLVKQETEQGEA